MKNKIKEYFNKLNIDKKKVISLLKYLLFIVVIVLLGIFIPRLSPIQHFPILTGSMAPNIGVGDLVIVNKRVDIDTLEPGDIISFWVDRNNSGTKSVVVHYVHTVIENEDGQKSFLTYSEMSTLPDTWGEIPEEDVIGKYIFNIPNIGSVILFLKTPIGIFIVIIDVFIIYYLIKMWKKDKKAKEEKA